MTSDIRTVPNQDDLALHPLVRSIGPREQKELARHATRITMAVGKLVAMEGDACGQVGLIVGGLMRRRHLSPEGRQHVLGYLTPGGCYGMVEALTGEPHAAMVDVLVEARVYAVPCDVFCELVGRWPGLGAAVAADLAHEAARFQEMVKDLALYSVRTRLARFLLDHAEDRAAPTQQWTQALIAEHIGTVRDVVGRVMRAFVEDGLVRREQGRMVITDEAGLRREAEHG